MNKKVMLITSLLLIALMVIGFSMAAATDTCPENPKLVEGNAPEISGYDSYKFDNVTSADFGNFRVYTTEIDGKEYYIKVTFSADGRYADWESDLNIKYVFVKGGPRGYEYCYGDGATSDTGLRSPLNDGGNIPTISHITFWWDGTIDPDGMLTVIKFYDKNGNGIFDEEEEEGISGWKFYIEGIGYVTTGAGGVWSGQVDPGTYEIVECESIIGNWVATTPTSQIVEVEADGDASAEFGNLCLGGGGGYTIGFWTNTNGQRAFNSIPGARLELVALNLKNARGNDFDPADYTAFRNWLRSAAANNMKYMLSAQLAAMKLNVMWGSVNGGQYVYAPGTGGADYITVNALMNLANTALNSSNDRAYLEALKNALDNANNNRNFVQDEPCDFAFACEEAE